MLRSRLKNIINKSNGISNKQKPVGDPFEEFVNSLPKELDYYKGENYRLKAAWKAYGSPKNYKEAVWEGLVQPIDENTFKMPSIGYNEEEDSYEYLNTGKENDAVAKDIRVWDNDVIPLVKELKLGGYIRIYNEEKNCWTYTKNSQKENTLDLNLVNILKELSGELKQEEVEAFKQGGQMNVIPEGALHARKNNMEGAGEEFTHKGIPVMDNGGEQIAEIERNEIIFSKDTTDKLECFYKKFYKEETTEKEKDEIAIKCGKFLTDLILNNTDDKTGLILEVELKM